jgi:hypothetical protein
VSATTPAPAAPARNPRRVSGWWTSAVKARHRRVYTTPTIPVLLRALIPPAVAALAVGGALLATGGTEECAAQGAGNGDVEARLGCPGGGPSACAANAGFVRAAAVPAGRRVRLRFTRRVKRGATVEVFQSSIRGRILGNHRVARFTRRKRSFTWRGRGARDGYLFVRFRVPAAGGTDVRRSVLIRRGGRFRRGPSFYRRASCATLAQFKLERPVFGGRRGRALGIAYRVATRSRVAVVVRRGRKVVRRFPTRSQRPRRTVRLRLGARKLPRGRYRVLITVRPERGVATRASLFAQRL